ncbi:hypothetical protein BaRGS_00034584, partial [Batillaria attramentaria]
MEGQMCWFLRFLLLSASFGSESAVLEPSDHELFPTSSSQFPNSSDHLRNPRHHDFQHESTNVIVTSDARHEPVTFQSSSAASPWRRHKRSVTSRTPTIAHCSHADDKDVALTRHGHTLLNVAIFAPYDLKFKFTLDRVLPAVVTAEQAVHRKQLLPGYRFHWIPGDSKCNSRDAAIHAFDTVTRYKMAFFLGPVCDYSLAPVARYAAYWNISVVAPGGFAHNFGTEKLDGPEGAEFPLLTRIGYTFNSMALTFLDLLTYYKWEKVKVLYRSSDHSDIVPAFCHLAGGALGEYLENEKRRKFDMHRIVEKTPEDYARMLLEQLDTQYAGQCHYRPEASVTTALRPVSLSPRGQCHYRTEASVTIAPRPVSLSPRGQCHYRPEASVPTALRPVSLLPRGQCHYRPE